MTERTIGRYRVERKLGAGAFGEVFLASLHGAMGFTKAVAIKVLAAERPGYDPRKLGSFINEARLGENLHHPNIVAIHEFAEADGHYYLVMEYIDGISLHEVLSVFSGRGVVLPVDGVCELGVQVCAGLDHAHRAKTRDGDRLQLIHRDLKPANLMLDRTGTIRIGDFGVARAAINPYFTTEAGEVKGTPRYMAPEQVTAEGPLTPAADVYSLGLVLCEVATGEPVFGATQLEPLLHQVLESKTRGGTDRLEATAPALVPVLRRALEREPAERYRSAAEMGRALRRVWIEHGGYRRLGVVADATLGIRAGRREGRMSPAVTAEVPAVEGAPADATPWERFQIAFADQLGERGALPEKVPAAGGSTRSRTRLRGWIVAGVAAVIVAAAVSTRFWPPPDGPPAVVEPQEILSDAIVDGMIEPVPEPPVEVEPTPEPPTPTPAPASPTLPPASEAPPAEPVPPPVVAAGPGFFKVNSRPWSEVWVDDVRIGHTGEPAFEVPAGEHEVLLVVPQSNQQKTYTVTVPVGATVNVGCWDFERDAVCR